MSHDASNNGDAGDLHQLLERVRDGEVTVDEAARRLGRPPLEPLEEFACIDHHRALRKGFPEVVFCEGKTPSQAARIMAQLAEAAPRVMGTRAGEAHYEAIRAELPEARYHEMARVVWVDRAEQASEPGREGVALVGAGTADGPVVEEARLTLELMGEAPRCYRDVGVAGLHRIAAHVEVLQEAEVVVVVAGMEGALPSVVAGLVEAPVIAVPTSVGYGSSFGGMAALLGMLNACSAGMAVVNIDNGFGAGYLAATINRRMTRREAQKERS